MIMLTLSAASLVDKTWYTSVRSKLKDRFMEDLNSSKLTFVERQERVDAQLNMVYGILNSSMQGDFTFFNLLGMGSFGIVFEGKNDLGKLISVKIMFDDSKYSNCLEAYNSYKALSSNPAIKYLIKIEDPNYFDKGGVYACSMLMERGYPTDKAMFPKDSAKTDSAANTLKLGVFITKLLEGHYTMTHLGGYYHGDVKPENLLYVKTETGLEPRIIDFDLVFKKKNMHYNPGNIIYTLTYRPPELRLIVPKTNPTAEQKIALRKYRYDADFREESWSVGKTIAKILSLNEEFVDFESTKFRKLRRIVDDLTANEIRNRICLQEAFELASALYSGRLII